MRIVVIIVAHLLLAGLWGCKIGSDQPQRNYYVFDQKVSLSPQKKEYSPGDIIWLEINAPDKNFLDLVTASQVLVGNAEIPISVDIDWFTIPDSDPPEFDLFLQEGVLVEDEEFAENGIASFSYGCPESDYSFKVGIQLKKPGAYLLHFNWRNPYFTIFFTEESDCSIQDFALPPPEADIGSIRFIVDATDTNRDKFEEFIEEQQIWDDMSVFYQALDNKELYFIWVK
jgi:hypothetical protein